jgi:hypothetical protein
MQIRGIRLNKWKYSVMGKERITPIFIQGVLGGRVNILRGHNIGHSKQIVFMYMCPIPNGFRDRVISLYSYKIVEKNEILRTVCNTGIYCSSGIVGTVYLA